MIDVKQNKVEDIPDALIPHLRATIRMDWENPPSFIAEALREIDLEKYDQLIDDEIEKLIINRCGEDAYRYICQLAKSRQSLNFKYMAMVQAKIVGERKQKFRDGIAFTTVRKERYCNFDGLKKMFETKVVEDYKDQAHPLLKAIRLYLDIIFVHPFNDGNSRAALLWFVFHCLKFNFPIADLRILIGFEQLPGNQVNYWEYSNLIIKEIASREK